MQSFGYTSLQSILLQAPGGATTCVAIYVSTLLIGSTRSAFRNAHHGVLALSCVPVLVGAIILWKGPPYTRARGAALAGYYLLPTFGAPYVILLSSMAANVRGRTKRAVAAGAVFVGYCVGNIIGPYLVRPSLAHHHILADDSQVDTDEAPIKYRTTWIFIIVVMVYTIVASFVMRWHLARENAKRDQLIGHEGQSRDKDDGAEEAEGPLAWREQTDRRDPAFRYTL
jgi:hypothetical protein